MKIKSFECPKSIRNYKKNNACNIRRLFKDSFVPSSQRTSILCCRLSDFKSNNKLLLKLHVDITQSSSNSLTQPASFFICPYLLPDYSDEPCLNNIKPFTGHG